MKKIPIGIMDYKELKDNNYYVVDKTLMIKEFLDSGSKVTLITRPRRFGKTLNMSMLAEFFNVTKDSSVLFKDTKIMNTEYASEINQWPTIFISFAGAKGNKKQLIKYIKQLLLDKYTQYDYIFKDMNYGDEAIYEDIKNNLIHFNDENISNIDNSLSFLMKRLEEYYHKKVMVIIDEYDTPFIEAHVNGYYEEIRNGLSSLLHNALKSSTSLQYAMMTGIQRVAKENIFSDLNNVIVCTMKNDEYSDYFGFVEDETKELLEYYGLSLNQDVKDMYDGYHIGNSEIYNPWSILNYAKRKNLEAFWVNTSSNAMIRLAIEKADESFNDGFEFLIQNDYLDTMVIMETSFFEVSNTENLWGLLANAGYLTIEEKIDDDYYRIRIPNKEVKKEFESLTSYYLKISNDDLKKIYTALYHNNSKLFYDAYCKILTSIASYHDLLNENSYHMIMLGLCVGLGYEYEIKSNREVGLGRYDIILKSQSHKPSYVIEFKYTDNENKLTDLASEAVQQIVDKKYDCDLTGQVIYIGLAHAGKVVEMQWIER